MRELGIVQAEGGEATFAHLVQNTMEEKVLASMDDKDEKIGAGILLKSLPSPCMQVAENAGIEGAVVLSKVQAMAIGKGFGWGWDAGKMKDYNLHKMDVIDPVTRLH